MKVKKTVAALCLAAIMATSVGASAEGLFGFWISRDPLNSEGAPDSWKHGVENNTVYSRHLSQFSETSYAMVYSGNSGVAIDWKYLGWADARMSLLGSYHEEFWAPSIKN